MNCTDVLDELDRYLEGRLNAERGAALEAHADACGECREALETARLLSEAAQALPRSIQPSSSLWDRIEDQLGEPAADRPIRFRRRTAAPMPVGRYGLAAAAMALVVLGAAVVSSFLQQPQQATQPIPVAVAPASEPKPEADAELTELTEQYLQAKDELMLALDARKGSLLPETAAMIEENMAIVESAIGEIRMALEAQPDAEEYESMLRLAYSSEVQMLRGALALVQAEPATAAETNLGA